MMKLAYPLLAASMIFTLAFTGLANAQWRTLDAPQALPQGTDGSFDSSGAELHYKEFGNKDGKPVLLLHGGLGSIEDFGGQVAALSTDYRVIGLDTRGHGRSTDGDVEKYTYAMFAKDVIALLDHLEIEKTAIIGWSDGGIIGLDLGFNAPERLTGVYALGANYQTSGLRPTVGKDALIGAYVGYAAKQYGKLSSSPDNYKAFSDKVFALWGGLPAYTDDQLKSISVPFVIAAGVYEEAIDEGHTKKMAELIPGAKLSLIGNTSHFALWQDVEAVNKDILDFLSGL